MNFVMRVLMFPLLLPYYALKLLITLYVLITQDRNPPYDPREGRTDEQHKVYLRYLEIQMEEREARGDRKHDA